MELWGFDDIVTEFICKDGQVGASVFKQPINDSVPAIDPDGYEYYTTIFLMVAK